MASVVVDPFHRAIKKHLDAMIDKVVDDLSNGSATTGLNETIGTSEKYAAQVAQIRTLRIMLALCDQVAEEIIRPAKVNIEER